MFDGHKVLNTSPVFADWVTETIKVSQGNVIPRRFSNINEAEMHITIESGKITSQIRIDNSDSELYKNALVEEKEKKKLKKQIEANFEECLRSIEFEEEETVSKLKEFLIEEKKLKAEKKRRLTKLKIALKKARADIKAGRPVPIKLEHIEY